MMVRYTASEIWEHFKMLRIDMFFLIAVFSSVVPGLSGAKLIQDKYCIVDLGIDQNLCYNLEKLGFEHEHIKDDVLRFSAEFANLNRLITTPSSIIVSIILGYWLDRNPGHLRYLMAVPCFCTIMSNIIVMYFIINFKTKTIYLLYGSIPASLSGGLSILIVGAYTYLGRRTASKYRTVRFSILGFFIFISVPVGVTIGGRMLTSEPWFPGQFRNYLGVYIIGTIGKLISAIWSVTMLYDAGYPPVEESDITNVDPCDAEKASSNELETLRQPTEEEQSTSELKKESHSNKINSQEFTSKQGASRQENAGDAQCETSFALRILKSTNQLLSSFAHTFGRKRENNKRTILWQIMICIAVLSITNYGDDTVEFQFVQKVYQWDVSLFAYFTSALTLISALGSFAIPAVLLHKFHLHDTTCAIIGIISFMLGPLIKGGFPEPWAFFVGAIISIATGLSSACLRTLVSRIIDSSEMGQVFSVFSCISTIGPVISSVIYTAVFKATISSLPGFFYHVMVITSFYPLIVALWLDYTKDNWDPEAIKAKQKKFRKKSDALSHENIKLDSKCIDT